MSDVGTDGIRPSDFNQIQSNLPSNNQCCSRKTIQIDDTKVFGTSGESAVVLGNVTFRLIGNLDVHDNCSWKFTGQLRAFNDVYDFNKSTHRGLAGEFSTAIGAQLPGAEFEIRFIGGKRITESGR